VRIEFILERNKASPSEFSRERNTILSKIALFRKTEEIHESFKRKPSKLDAGAFSILLTCEN
jgi:hypothetical protein